MNIGFFTDTFLPQRNGVVTSIESFGRELVKQGHNVDVFCPACDQKTHLGMNVHSCRALTFKPYPEFKLGIPRKMKPPALDIVHTHGPFSLGWYGLHVAKKQRIPLAIAFFGVILITLSLGVSQILREDSGGQVFWALFLYSFVTLFTFNLYDLLVLDWLIFVTIQPAFVVLPGTEGASGYKDYFFHFRGFLIGIGFCFIAGLIVAGLGSLVNLMLN